MARLHNKELVRVTDMEQVPHHVQDRICETGMPFLELCVGCEQLFRGDCCLCAVCAKPISVKAPSKRSKRPIPDDFTRFHLRKYAAKSDFAHEKCIRAATRRFEAEGKHTRARMEEAEEAEPDPPLKCEVDIGRDKKMALSDNEKKMFGFFLSCQRHQNQITFTMPVPRKGNKGGTQISATLTPVVRGKSQRSRRRQRHHVVGMVEHMASDPNADISATDIVKDTALHSRVGMLAKLNAEEDQTPIDGEAMQADMKGSMRKLKKVLTHCRKAGNVFKHSVKVIQERKRLRRLPMLFEKAKVYHPSYSQDQTLYMKRPVSLCGIVANRMAQIFENSGCFIELDGVTQGASGDIYLTFAVCGYVHKNKHFFSNLQFTNTQHKPGSFSLSLCIFCFVLFSLTREGALSRLLCNR